MTFPRPVGLLAAVLLIGLPAQAQEVALFVDGDGVCLRDAPSLERSQVIGTLYRGDEVRIRDARDQWRNVWVPRTRQVGWVAHWLLAEVPPPGYRREVATVAADDVNLRTGPGSAYATKGSLKRGTVVDVIAYADQWRKIRVPTSGAFGWVAGWLLGPVSSRGDAGGTSGGTGQPRWVAADELNLRANPGTGNAALARLKRGTKVYLLNVEGEWARVHVHDGPVGWVHRDYLKEAPPPGGAGGIVSVAGSSANVWGTPRYVGVDELYLRPGPGLDNRPLAILTKGKTVYIMYLQDEWAQVQVHNGDIGWVFRDYLKEAAIPGCPGEIRPYTDSTDSSSYDTSLDAVVANLSDRQAVVTKNGCNVRSGPGTAFQQVAVVDKYTVLTVAGQASGWYKVSTPDGQTGWIASWLCETSTAPPQLPASDVPAPPSVAVVAGAGDPQGIGKRIAELALSQVGKPYVWGAESPSRGFDCSGLVYWSHGELGITMMRTSFDMWDDPSGKLVPTEALQPGDVVCFANTYRRGVSHVGIYVGNGEYVHAPGHGKTVRVDSLSERTRSYCGAKRFY